MKKTSEKSRYIYLLLSALLTVMILVSNFSFKSEIERLENHIYITSQERDELYQKNKLLNNQNEKNSFFLEYTTDKAFDFDFLKNNLSQKEIVIPTKKASEYIKNVSSEVSKNNLKYMDNIQCYKSEFIIEYVSAEKNKKSSYIVLNYIKELSDDICKNASTDAEKANCIAMWVCKNIYYHNEAASTEVTTDTISLENVISLKRTTCAGYSNLFSALCQAQGLYCINLRGGASKNGDLTQIPTNHEWNGVFCDGQWIFYDTTWASSNFFENKEKISGPTNEEYIEMSFEEMSTQRRIDKLDFRNFYFAVSDYFN